MKRTSPVIGITCDFNPRDKDAGEREPTYFLRARYVTAIEELGGLPLLLPITAHSRALVRLLRMIDGLLITGSGPDLDPALYGEKKVGDYTLMSRERAAFEMELARLAFTSRLPVLGVCGGMQVLNVALGGSLYQDIPRQRRGALPHRQTTSATQPAHPVTVLPGTRLSRLLRRKVLAVNSSHHQAVKTTAPGLAVNATSEDGLIEGIEDQRHPFFLGVQWHPEFLYQKDASQRRLFQGLLKAALK